MTATTAPARNWGYAAPLGARVVFLNADSERRVRRGTRGVVVWVADGGQLGRDVELSDGRTVNIPSYELDDAPVVAAPRKSRRKAARTLRYTPGDEVAVMYAPDARVRYVRVTLDDVAEKDRAVFAELTPDEARHLAARLAFMADRAEQGDAEQRADEARRARA